VSRICGNGQRYRDTLDRCAFLIAELAAGERVGRVDVLGLVEPGGKQDLTASQFEFTIRRLPSGEPARLAYWLLRSSEWALEFPRIAAAIELETLLLKTHVKMAQSMGWAQAQGSSPENGCCGIEQHNVKCSANDPFI